MNIRSRNRRGWISTMLVLALAVAACLPAVSHGADKRTITETDLFRFVWVADPQISPDGSRTVFTRVWVNQKADGYEPALGIVPAGGGAARQLPSGPRDANPRWSPDGAAWRSCARPKRTADRSLLRYTCFHWREGKRNH